MKTYATFLILLFYLCLPSSVLGQTCNPCGIVRSANGKIVTADTLLPNSSYSGSAPIVISFSSRIEESDWSHVCEWRIYTDDESSPIRVYFDDDFEYTFKDYGTTRLKLYTTFTNKTTGETTEYVSNIMSVVVAQSSLKVPNAFSPNGDGTNDKLNVSHESLVKFDAYIFNRWGQKLYHWGLQNIDEGWDGTHNGTPVKDGVYFILIDAKGADGIEYKIKKDVNLLRGLSQIKK